MLSSAFPLAKSSSVFICSPLWISPDRSTLSPVTSLQDQVFTLPFTLSIKPISICCLVLSLSHIRLFVTSRTVTLSQPPGSSVHGISLARILEWVATPFSRGSSQGLNPGLSHCRQVLYHLSHQGSPLHIGCLFTLRAHLSLYLQHLP